MESQSNDSSSDSDMSPDTKHYQSNHSDSESQDETASSTPSPTKSIPERVSLNITRISENLIRTTSLSSQNSDLNPNLLPGKRAPVKDTHKGSDTEPREYDDPMESKRVTRSSRRGGPISSIELKVDQIKSKAKSKKKSTRKSSRRSRKKLPIKHTQTKESDFSSEAEEVLYPSSPPLVLLVSIPIDGEDNSSLSEALSESSEPALHTTSHTKGKHISSLEQEYASNDSGDNSSSEDSDSVTSSREDSAGEDKAVTSQQRESWEHQVSSKSEVETQSECESESQIPTRSHKLIACEKIIMSYQTDRSGKSIPNKKRSADRSESSKTRVSKTAGSSNKRRSHQSSAADKNKNIKHVIQLDTQLESDQLEAVLLESYSILRNRDQQAIFSSPVTDDIAPGYSKLIKQPMDFSRMKEKIDTGEYNKLEELTDDFVLMCRNAMSYNKPTTFYYRAAKRIKEAGVKSLEKMARTHLTSLENENRNIHSVMSPPTQAVSSGIRSDSSLEDIGPLLVRIDRNLLTASFSTSKRLSQLTSIRTSLRDVRTQDNDTSTKSLPVDAAHPSIHTKSTQLDTPGVMTQEISLRKSQKDESLNNPDTSLLPPPSSFSQSLSSKSQTATPTQNTTESTHSAKQTTSDNAQTASFSSGKKRHSSLEIKQRKLMRKQEQTYLRSFIRAAQARRTYRGSLAPVRPLNHGSFASFAPNYDSSFATINGQETDRMYSLLDHKELRECDDSMLYTNYNDEVSPYYLRLADGILNLDKDTDYYDKNWSRRSDRNIPQEMIRLHVLRQQAAFQEEMRRRIESPPDSVRAQQQLDDMLQQSAELISSLIQKQGKEECLSGEEELEKISKILSSIGTTLKTSDAGTPC